MSSSSSTSAPACRPSRSWASPTPPCARRASESRRRSATAASSGRRGGSPPTSPPATSPRPGPDSTWRWRARSSRRPARCRSSGWRRIAMFGELGLDGTCARRRARSPSLTRRAVVASRCSRSRRRPATRPRSSTGSRSRRCARCRSAARAAARRPGRPAAAALRGGRGRTEGRPAHSGPARASPSSPTSADCRHAVRALLIAAAGGHNLLLSGPPGVGKTMLARRAARDPAAAGRRGGGRGRPHRTALRGGRGSLDRRRPFRAPHHTTTAAGLVGGAPGGWPGEAVMAHRGVLFLDELARVRARRAAMPCVSRWRTAAWRSRAPGAPSCGPPASCSSARPTRVRAVRAPAALPLLGARARTPRAAPERPAARQDRPARRDRGPRRRRRGDARHERQRHETRSRPRAGASAGGSPRMASRLNSELDARSLARSVRLDEARASARSEQARRAGLISARGEHSARAVARTIADLAGRERVETGRRAGGARPAHPPRLVSADPRHRSAAVS